MEVGAPLSRQRFGSRQGPDRFASLGRGLHDHPGGEETYLISGKLKVGEHCLVAGDYLWTPPGVAHDGYAEEDTELFLVLPAGIQVAAAPGGAAQGRGDSAQSAKI